MRSVKILTRIAWRNAWRRPLQSIFLIFGVAIGVAMIVAIDLANGSAQRAFELGTETVAGRATHQIMAGPTGLDQDLYIQLRRDLDYRLSAPIVEEYVVAPALDEQPMRLLGIDSFAEAPFRSYLGTGSGPAGPSASYLSGLMAQPNTILLSSVVAERYGVEVGQPLTVRVGSNNAELNIVGLLEPTDDLSRRALDGLLIADIATAQEVLGRVNRLDRIDLILPPGESGDAVIEQINTILPPSALIQRSAARAGTVDEMTEAFRMNLTALSLLALVVGMFLIYNTVTFSVVQRRPILGSLRSLGMTQREIFGLILGEAALLGLLGTVLGLGFGILLGFGAVRAVTQTINDLFFVVAVREVDIPAFTLIKGAVIGISAAIIGAAIPAYEATSVPPAGAMQRSNVEGRILSLLPWLSGLGALLLAIGAALLIPEWTLEISFGGLFAVILGCALLTPILTLWMMRGVSWIMDKLSQTGGPFGVIGRMAPRYIIRSLSRTSVAVAALMVAVSVIIGVGIMIGSFRGTVETWLEDILQADIFIAPPSLGAGQVTSTIDPQIVDSLSNLDGVTRAATTRSVTVLSFVNDAEASEIGLIALSEDIAGEGRDYRDSVGDWLETWEAVVAGGALINEPMANRTGLGVGDTIELQTERGRQAFSIVGIPVSFDVNSIVYLDDAVYRELWDDTAISAVGLFVEPSANVDQMVDQIRGDLANANTVEMMVSSNIGLRQNALDVFDRTFAITIALQLLATLVAFIGILSTLMSLQLERRREIGVLRANGMTRGQLWRLSLFETGLIGSTAGLIAIPTGFLLSIILIYIINLRSFGWSLQMQLESEHFVQAFGVALIAALLAGLYPAWRMGQMQPANALRSE